jgi:hypothetical protein
MQVWGGGNNALVRMHLQRVEDNVQYQFNFKPEGIIYDGDSNPIGLVLSGQGELSGNGSGSFDATARIEARGEGVFILVNGMPRPSVGLQFEAEGSLTFEEKRDPPQ